MVKRLLPLIFCMILPFMASADSSVLSSPATGTSVTDTQVTAEAQKTSPAESKSWLASFNSATAKVLFWDVSFGAFKNAVVDKEANAVVDSFGVQEVQTIQIPLIIAVLFLGAIFFTFRYKWINLRGFRHAIDVISGKFDRPEDKGEISHFRAFTSALSATVGLGNIAGVAIAIQLGGPGAVFWMIIAAIFGMSSKFNSCTLSQMFRQVNSDGSISGGPMYYLDIGLKKMGPIYGKIGKVLAVMFGLMVMMGAIGGGNMFQVNQTVEAFTSTFNLPASASVGIGIIMLIFVGTVILGGIRRIGAATSRVVPLMCGIYVLASLFVILVHLDKLPRSFYLIISMAFSGNAFYGGFVGVLVWGVRRASFSNEAGLGSAAIAHAAAKTDEPVREGMVAMMGPFVDTIIICVMTALVVIITGAWQDSSIPQNAGVTLTTAAFGSVLPWFKYVLTASIGLFAYSTMISWCYYGERGWIYLLDHFNGLGLKTVVVFRVVYLSFVMVGATYPLKDVLEFTDLMILSMALPNIIGGVILSKMVKSKANDYWDRYQSGKMKPVK